MSEKQSLSAEKLSEGKMPEFTADGMLAEIRDKVVRTALGVGGASRKDMLARTAKALGLTYSRVQDYYYGEVRRVEAHEAAAITYRAQQAEAIRIARLAAEYRDARARFIASSPAALARMAPPPLGDDVEAILETIGTSAKGSR